MKSFALILVAFVPASPAIAQRAPGTGAPEFAKPPTLDQVTSYQEMNDCQMRPNLDAGKALLASTNMADASRHASRFKWQACGLKKRPGGTMTVVPNKPKLDELRWLSAEYFLSHHPEAAAGLSPVPIKSAYALDWFSASSRDDAIDAMAACVADSDPQRIIALNNTQVGSTDERAALKRLAPFLTTCLRAGVTLNGDRKAIRGALLDALYQRARVERPALLN